MKSILKFIGGLIALSVFIAILGGLVYLIRYAFGIEESIIKLGLQCLSVSLSVVWLTFVVCIVVKIFNSTDEQVGRAIRQRIADSLIPDDNVLKRLLQNVLIDMNAEGYKKARDVLDQGKNGGL